MALWVLGFVVVLAVLVAIAAFRRPPRRLPLAAPPPRPAPRAIVPDALLAAPEPEPDALPSSRTLARIGARGVAPPAPPLPVVFAHGFAGFDEIRLLGASAAYFRGVRERVGEDARFTRVPAFAGVEERAAHLAEQIRAVDAERVHVVAHSMGGLDARWAIARLGLGNRVASLTTVGTPHRGTPLADAGVRLVRRSRHLADALARMGLSPEALEDLSVARMSRWNHEVRDVPGVRYASFVSTPLRTRDVAPPLLPGYALLAALSGANDGLVPSWSQPWGEVLGHVDADHWGAVGWSSGRFDAPAFYEDLVRALQTQEPLRPRTERAPARPSRGTSCSDRLVDRRA